MKLALAGGGTGGHIMPNIALIEAIKREHADCQILYFGSRKGMEKQLVKPFGVRYRGIFCGKLRRYFTWRNIDLLLFPVGILQSFFSFLFFRPSVVFCKGGFVSTPVAIGAWLARVPVVLHESDVIPGLGNKISALFARNICVSFEESKKYFPKSKVIVTGNPVREKVLNGERKKALEITGLDGSKPTVLVLGGSLGATAVNDVIYQSLSLLLKHYQVIHVCGKGKMKLDEGRRLLLPAHDHHLLKNYVSYEFVTDELPHFYALADVLITRAGANTLAEIDALQKPALLIPLGTKASRGDQIVNADIFAKNHHAKVLHEEDFLPERIVDTLNDLTHLAASKNSLSRTEKNSNAGATRILLKLLEDYANRR